MTKDEKEKAIRELSGYLSMFVRFSINEINISAKSKEDAEYLYNSFEKGLFFTLCSHYFTDEKGNIDTQKTEECMTKLNEYFTYLILDMGA